MSDRGLIRWAARHPVVPVALVGIVLCLGAAALWRLPISYLFTTPRQTLWIWLQVPGDLGRDHVLARVVRPLERQALADPGVDQATTLSIRAGSALIELDTTGDPEQVAGRLRERAHAVARSAPSGTTIAVQRERSEAEQPGLIVQLAGIGRDEVEHDLVPRLQAVEGLRRVRIFPDAPSRLHLEITDPDPAVTATVFTPASWHAMAVSMAYSAKITGSL